MNQSLKVLLGFILLLGFNHFDSLAQNKDLEGEIEDAEIVIKKNRKIELPTALMPSEKITYPLRPEPKRNYEFNYLDYKLRLPDLDSRIRVLTMKDEPLEALSNTYIQGGLGNLGSTLFRVYHGTKRTDNWAWSVGLEHRANRRGPNTFLPSGQSENQIFGNWEKAYRKSVLSGKVLIGRERFNFYGYPKDFGLNEDQAKRIFQNGEVALYLENRPDSTRINYKIGAVLTGFGSTRNFPEKNFRDLAETGGQLSAILSKRKTNGREVILGGKFNYLQTEGAGLSYQRLRAELFNQLRIGFEGWDFGIGYKLIYENDTLGGGSNFHPYPMLEASRLLKNKSLRFSAKVDGDNEWVTLQDLTQRNPWLNRGVPAFYKNQKLRASVALATTSAQNWQWQIGLGHKWVQNFAVFETAFPDSGRFNINYLSRTIGISSATAGIKFHSKSRFTFDLQGEYLHFSSLGDAVLYHTPNGRISTGITYNLKNKIVLGTRITAFSNVEANRPDGGSKKLKGIVDWDIDLDYNFSRRFGMFIQLDNLLNQQNQPFQYYPTRGFMFILGLKATL